MMHHSYPGTAMYLAWILLTQSLVLAADKQVQEAEGKGVWDFIVGNGPRFCKCYCGRPNTLRERLLGGQFVEAHEYPWLAILHVDLHHIAGVLLNERYVITAANQLLGTTPYNIKVTVGEYNICSGDTTTANLSVSDIKIHPEYDPETRSNNIALVRLSNTVVPDRWVSTICLPKPGATYENLVADVVGWGEGPTLEGPIISTCRPRKIGLPILSDRECLLGSSTVHGAYTKDKGCAGVLGLPAVVCSTDSGGPVQFHSFDGTVELIGVLADTNVCTESISPTIYTRINAHLPWIFQNTKDSCYCANANKHPLRQRNY